MQLGQQHNILSPRVPVIRTEQNSAHVYVIPLGIFFIAKESEVTELNKEFLRSNTTRDRLLRTILQGVIGVVIANLDLIFSFIVIPAELKPFIAAIVMAILSPIMSELGKDDVEYLEGDEIKEAD